MKKVAQQQCISKSFWLTVTYIREQDPDAKAYILYRDIRTPGLYENFYRKQQDDPGIFLTICQASSRARRLAALRPIFFYMLAALRPYIYMCGLPRLAAENGMPYPHAALHFTWAISIDGPRLQHQDRRNRLMPTLTCLSLAAR